VVVKLQDRGHAARPGPPKLYFKLSYVIHSVLTLELGTAVIKFKWNLTQLDYDAIQHPATSLISSQSSVTATRSSAVTIFHLISTVARR